MYKLIVHLLAFLLIIVIAYELPGPNSFKMNSISSFSQTAAPVNKQETALMQEIKEKSKHYEEPPQNAVIDKVWKKLPGRNGIQVNVKKSFEKMKKKGNFDESLLVFEQIEPEVSLSDLPPSPIYKGHPEKQMVSLLMNVSWGSEYIPSILKTLKKHEVNINFFIEGKWAKKNTDLVKMIAEQGHLIGNHAYNHPDMKRLSNAENRKQILQTNQVLKAITGDDIKWFTPPSGSLTNEVVSIASDLDMETVLWSVDTIDWRKPAPSVMINRVASKLHPGAIILMHPTQVTDKSMDELIKMIKKEYKIGTVEKLLNEKR